MARKIETYIKLQVAAGQANPSPPVGPALGQHGVNIMEFCKAFNAATQGMEQGMPIPVVISVHGLVRRLHVDDAPPVRGETGRRSKKRRRKRLQQRPVERVQP